MIQDFGFLIIYLRDESLEQIPYLFFFIVCDGVELVEFFLDYLIGLL